MCVLDIFDETIRTCASLGINSYARNIAYVNLFFETPYLYFSKPIWLSSHIYSLLKFTSQLHELDNILYMLEPLWYLRLQCSLRLSFCERMGKKKHSRLFESWIESLSTSIKPLPKIFVVGFLKSICLLLFLKHNCFNCLVTITNE